jgi:hypothetical protein
MSGSSSREAGGGAAKLPTSSGTPVVIIMADCYSHSGSTRKCNEKLNYFEISNQIFFTEGGEAYCLCT